MQYIAPCCFFYHICLYLYYVEDQLAKTPIMSRTLKDALRNSIAWLKFHAARLESFRKKNLELSVHNWRWITYAALAVIFLFTAGYMIFLSGDLSVGGLFVAGILFVVMPLLYGFLIKLGLRIARRIPVHLSWLVLAAVSIFFIYFGFEFKAMLVLIFYLLFTFIFIAGALSNLFSRYWKTFPRFRKLVNIFFLTVGFCNLVIAIFFLSYPGPATRGEKDFSMDATHTLVQISLPNPSLPGPFKSAELTYGTASDRHRMEFAAGADMVSSTVDGSLLLDGWDKLSGRLRTSYWGFGPDSLPLNGRIWLPEGDGPFPVVMVVHGNHFDRDFSDAGYAYLGRHLASHGYLVASVDENFLNSGMTDFGNALQEENDARGWLLLKHLELLRDWSNDPDSKIYKKADTGKVILVGHSRGGEAVNIAAGFNNLEYYPDNAELNFDFRFGIKGIVAIAQVDGQYKPVQRPARLLNVNYLCLQGSMDADLESYEGLSQFNRISFSDSLFHFKSGLYIENANHGQFNSSWGVNDIGYPRGLLLNRRKLLEQSDQEQIALVYITAFTRASLEDETGYLPLFADYRSGADWLPSTRYLNQYMDNEDFILADYEEDIDLTTGSFAGTKIRFKDLASVYEQDVWLEKVQMGSNAICIGWNNEGHDSPGVYSIEFPGLMRLPDSIRQLRFDITVLDRDPGERHGADDGGSRDLQLNGTNNRVLAADENMVSADGPGKTNKEQEYGATDNEDEEQEYGASDNEDDEQEQGPYGLSICLADADGDSAIVSTLDFFPLNAPVISQYYKLKIFGGEGVCEPVPQHIGIGLEHFREQNSALDTDRLRSVEFIFNKGESGMISLDNIGFKTTKTTTYEKRDH